MKTEFKNRAGELKERVEKVLQRFVASRVAGEGKLTEAIRYAAATDGKRIRPLLSYATADLLNVPYAVADIPAAALELLHTYSLVHDDLPAMDDDDLRRGIPTVHKAYDEATAILVGDALHTLAFELLVTGAEYRDIAVGWVQELAKAAGPLGMIQGQATDLEGETRMLNLDELEAMHRKKSGALIEASMVMVAQAAIDEPAALRLSEFSHHIGLAFQICDDVLDIESTTEQLGKPRESDIAKNKSTFVSLLGMNEAKLRMHEEYEQARSVLADLDGDTSGLVWLAEYIVERKS